jgi:CBS domain-containing protein
MKKYLINYNDTIHKAIKKIDINGKRSLVVVKNKKLFGTISDGDIRKILLKNISLKNKISKYVNIKPIKIKKSIDYKKKAEDYFKKKTDLSLIPIVDRFNNILNVFSANNLKKKNKCSSCYYRWRRRKKIKTVYSYITKTFNAN